MIEILDKYKDMFINKMCKEKIVKSLKDNIFLLILFFCFPLILSILLRAIFEYGFFEYIEYFFEVIRSMSIETLIDDIRMLIYLMFSAESKLEYQIIFSLEMILYGITRKKKNTFIILIIFFMIMVSINHFVFQLRGAPLSITDFLAVSTAFNVMSGYTLNITNTYIISILLGICFIILIMILSKKEKKLTNIYVRILFIIIGIVLIFLVINKNTFKKMNIWNLSDTYQNSGQIITMIKTIDKSKVEIADNYSDKMAKDILNSYNTNEEKIDDLPNILVIMNESFSDIKDVYGLEIDENLNFFKSLQENTISGTLYTSVKGGKTSITEWEFLTGNSSAFIPYASIPYIQYINADKESLVSLLNDLNYQTFAFHSYRASGYNRRNAYDKLLFKSAFFYEDMKELETRFPTDYPTDTCTYDNYFELTKKSQERKFGFIVTMQNHSPYQIEKEKIKEYIRDEEIDSYLSLINESDKALEGLIKKLKNSNEKTILLFFGDHQPAFISNKTELFLEKEWMQNYQVPFLIWANYDIEEQSNFEISANYLSVLLTDIANIPKTPYLNFLSYIQQKIPIITGNGYKGSDGNIYQIQDVESPYYELINQYNIVQYYQMFERISEKE